MRSRARKGRSSWWGGVGVGVLLGAAGWEVTRRWLLPSDASTSLYFPAATGAWETIDPGAAGWDEDALEAALDLARRRLSTGVVLLQGGRIMAERYWDGATVTTSADIFSAQKSVTSVLVGIAQHEDRIHVEDPVTRWLGPRWSRATPEQEAQVLLSHLLTMTSGLDSQLRFQQPPGTVWYYNTAAYHLLQDVLVAATGLTLQAYSDHVLFGPLGMASATWATDPDPATPPGDRVRLELTPRDMARFGLLVLAQGRWAGAAILGDPEYLQTALSPSQVLNPSYGRLWWLNGAPTHELPGEDPQPEIGPIIPAAPADLVAALGTSDEKIYVVPSLDLVVTRQGRPAGPADLTVSSFDNVWWEELRAAAPGG